MKNAPYEPLLAGPIGDNELDKRINLSFYSTLVVFFIFCICVTVSILIANDQTLPEVTFLSVRQQKPKQRNITRFQDYYFTKDETQFLNCSEMMKENEDAIKLYVNSGRIKLDSERLFDLPMDCYSIKQRIYGDSPPFRPLKRQIAFVRNIYELYELQEALLSISYHPDNVFCYVIDSKSTDRLKTSMRRMSSCFPNIVVLDKEYDFNSGGHGQDPAHFDCLEKILDRKWDHAIILQSFDIIIKSPQNLSDISEILNDTSVMGFDFGLKHRYNTSLDWTPAGIGLFKNETGVPDNILHTNLRVRKSLNQVILSKVFVKSMFEKLNIQNVLKRFDDSKYYGVDEMMVQTLYGNYLGLDGQMTSNCTGTPKDILTRYTHWSFNGPNGWNTNCKSNWKRHGICVLGAEYLKDISETPRVVANKVMATFDFGTIICTREMVRNNQTGRIPDAKWFEAFPQFREMQLKRNGTYDADKFDC